MFKSSFDKSDRFSDIHPIHRKAAKKYWTKLTTMCWRLDQNNNWVMVKNPTWKPWLTYWVGNGYPPDIDTSEIKYSTKEDLYNQLMKYKSFFMSQGITQKELKHFEDITRMDYDKSLMQTKNGVSYGVML